MWLLNDSKEIVIKDMRGSAKVPFDSSVSTVSFF